MTILQKYMLALATAMALILALNSMAASPRKPELLVYCGITMVRPITEIAQRFEQAEKVRIRIAQGGSEDLYQSAKKSRVGDLYFPGEPSYRSKHLAEGLLGEYVTVGYNQIAIFVQKGNPKKIKGDLRELLRKDVSVLIGSAESGSVGKEAQDILVAKGIYDLVVDKAIFLAPDSRGLNNAMKKREADAILNWRATGFFPDVAEVVDVIDLDPAVAKPQALLLNLLTFSKSPTLARRFMDYAASRDGEAIFRKHGFLANTAPN